MISFSPTRTLDCQKKKKLDITAYTFLLSFYEKRKQAIVNFDISRYIIQINNIAYVWPNKDGKLWFNYQSEETILYIQFKDDDDPVRADLIKNKNKIFK